MNYKYFKDIPDNCVVKLEFEKTVYTYCVVLEKTDKFIKFKEVYTKINDKEHIKDIRFSEGVNKEIKFYSISLENENIRDFQLEHPEWFL